MIVNNIGQVHKTQDQSGVTEIIEFDFKGNPLKSEKSYCNDYQNDVDWSQSPTLQDETFNQAIEYDALNRPTLLTQPDGSKIRYAYNKGAMLEKVDVQHRGQGNYQSYVSNVNYNEKGQRTDIYYGNNSKTKYEYDSKTFRVTRILTTRNTGIDILQNIYYFYDSIGNITEMRDDAQQIHYFDNAVIAPTGKYEYDPLYRLLKAEGRELCSLNAPDSNDFANNIPVPNPSANAMQNYTQLFVYDALGNIQTMSSQNQWTRTYNYNNTANNYLSSTQVGQDVFSYTYDVHGNMTSMPHLSSMQWDFADRLRRVQLNLSGDTAYYIYDSTGNRCRKVVEKGGVREERYYVDGYEVFRKFVSGDLDFERQSLHISDDEKKFASIETKTWENGELIVNPVPAIRYQYDNHLGSACLELDETASIISYEEYHSFGTTSYRSVRTETEVSLKRYKYVGKERDEETGLYYYGARYYAAWLCRFVSVDALQFEYPHYTPYQYAGNKPISYIDLDGLEEAKKNTSPSPPVNTDNYSSGAIADKYENGKKYTWYKRNDGNWLNITNYKKFTVQGKTYYAPVDLTADVPKNLVGYKGYTYNLQDLIMRYNVMHGNSRVLKQSIINFEKKGWAEPLTGANFWRLYGQTLGSLLAMQVYITEGAGMAAGAQGGGGHTPSPKKYSYTQMYTSKTLYRAVSQSEAIDIEINGFRNLSGYESGKLFTNSAQKAANYGRINYSFDKLPFTIVKTSIPVKYTSKLYYGEMDLMNAVAVPKGPPRKSESCD